MRTIEELYAFAEELIEYAMMGGDQDTALVIEEAVDEAMGYPEIESQLASILAAFVSVEERINIPDYPVESVITLRMTLRSMNIGTGQRYNH